MLTDHGTSFLTEQDKMLVKLAMNGQIERYGWEVPKTVLAFMAGYAIGILTALFALICV